MSVFLGNNGHVELLRDSSSEALLTHLDPDDVNTVRKRFSVDFAEASLITGDQVTIATVDHSPLELVANHLDENGDYFNDWRGYIHIDDAGGLRLYSSFEDALSGGSANALDLVQPTAVKQVSLQSRDSPYNCLAQVTQYELTTSRDQVQTDALGDEFRSYYEAGIISGQGSLDCFWEHSRAMCEDGSGGNYPEFSSYLSRLILRLKQGSGFRARFYIYANIGEPSVWYEARCLVINVGLSVEPSQVVRTQIQFAATGPITLHQGEPPATLLREQPIGGAVLQEDGSGILGWVCPAYGTQCYEDGV